jgi:hypothetical protein
VLRLMQQAEIPPGFPISANESTIDYEFAAVGASQYLCPPMPTSRREAGGFSQRTTWSFASTVNSRRKPISVSILRQPSSE